MLLGGLAVAYGFQMWPALIAVCYWPFLTRQGIILGLIAGLIAVTMTETIGQNWFGIEAWGRWPWTIHSAGWGILFNLGIAIIVSAITRDDMDRKMEFHNFLAQHAALPPEKRKLVPTAWIITLVWFFFGIGPGAVIGNWAFGDPTDATTWTFGMPSIWAWQFAVLGARRVHDVVLGLRHADVDRAGDRDRVPGRGHLRDRGSPNLSILVDQGTGRGFGSSLLLFGVPLESWDGGPLASRR